MSLDYVGQGGAPNGQVIERSGTFYIRYYRTHVEVGKQVRSRLSERLCDKGQVHGVAEARDRPSGRKYLSRGPRMANGCKAAGSGLAAGGGIVLKA